ncbi:VOC family protein [Methanobacterium sp. ACI-7]|uniref:VOC family protein n=1 Tax=unclassified Methanobacterium TaxID=2627676 RepID=UPI0039C106FF
MKIKYTNIAVDNLEEEIKFYTNVLGFEENRRFTPEKGVNVAFLKGEGDSMLELVEGMDKQYPQMKDQKGLFMVGLEVENMEKTARELKDEGIEFTRGPIDTANGTKIAFLKDPQGVQIELIQPP